MGTSHCSLSSLFSVAPHCLLLLLLLLLLFFPCCQFLLCVCARALGYLGSLVTLCTVFLMQSCHSVGLYHLFINEFIYRFIKFSSLHLAWCLFLAAPLLDWQVASHGKIPYPIGVMQQHFANWVECVARLSSVNPSVAVLSSVCLHLTGSKSVFVCLIMQSCLGVLCFFFINVKICMYMFFFLFVVQ